MMHYRRDLGKTPKKRVWRGGVAQGTKAKDIDIHTVLVVRTILCRVHGRLDAMMCVYVSSSTIQSMNPVDTICPVCVRS